MNEKPLIAATPYSPPGGVQRYTHEEFEKRDAHHRQSIIEQIPARQNLSKEREELERSQAELEAKEAAMLGKYNRLDSLNRERGLLIQEMDYGRGHAANLEQYVGDIEHTLDVWCFPGKHPNPGYQSTFGTMSLVSNAMAAEKALEYFPKWLEARTKKLGEIEREMKALAKELKLTDKLPVELQK